MAKEFCPECGYHLHRSRSRNLREKLIRAASRLKLFRCHECGWRGWIASEVKPDGSLPRRKNFLSFTLVVIAMLLITVLAFYFID